MSLYHCIRCRRSFSPLGHTDRDHCPECYSERRLHRTRASMSVCPKRICPITRGGYHLAQLARQRGWPHTRRAVFLAAHLHAGQTRKSGGPYIVHPLAVAWKLVHCGVEDDGILAAALLHDVLEDCADEVAAQDLQWKHGLPCHVDQYIQALTQDKSTTDSTYYQNVADIPEAIVVKLADRLHNNSTMIGPCYNQEKKLTKAKHTEQYVLPLYDATTGRFNKYHDIAANLTAEIERLNRTHAG